MEKAEFTQPTFFVPNCLSKKHSLCIRLSGTKKSGFSGISRRNGVFLGLMGLFFVYGGVAFAFGIKPEKELLNSPFRVTLQTRKPHPIGLLNPAGCGFDHRNSHSAVRNERTRWCKRWLDSFECVFFCVGLGWKRSKKVFPIRSHAGGHWFESSSLHQENS